MDGHELLDFFVNTFGCSSLDAFCFVSVAIGGMMGGFVFLTDVFMDAGRVLARLLCDFVRWSYKRFKVKRKEP